MLAAALRGLTILMLVMFTLLPAGCQRQALNASPEKALPPSHPSGPLQEVSPPGAVLQLQHRLVGRQPRVNILAPANGSLLPDGPWTLTVAMEDWPLAEAGPLGIGPHLVVQLDGDPPIRVEGGSSPLDVPMAPLAPGSHRLTAYAAFPWGEAVKAPGASQQIRLHRVAPNPQGLPAEGTPQLIAVQMVRASADQPALLDWLLVDAPLQHLREGDDRWRLRITVNGDSFLVDRQAPLWLRGLRNGSNAVVLELLDQTGQPLNPPFNSAVQELVLGSAAPRGWQLGALSDDELERLLGQAPIPSPPEAPQPSPPPINSADNARRSDPGPSAEAITAPPSPSPDVGSERAAESLPASPVAPEIVDSSASAPESAGTVQRPTAQDRPAPPMPTLPAPSTASVAATASEPEPTPEPSDEQEQRPAEVAPRPDPVATASLTRDRVNPDGSIKPQDEGLLGRLRAKFGR